MRGNLSTRSRNDPRLSARSRNDRLRAHRALGRQSRGRLNPISPMNWEN